MAEIVNKETGKKMEVPIEQVGAAVQSGQYFTSNPDVKVPVVDEAGKVGMLGVQHIQSGGMKGAGFRPATAAEIKEQRLQQEYGEGIESGLKAVGYGAARGLTVSTSDLLLTEMGVSPEELREIKERRGLLSGASEIAGLVAPLIATAGGSSVVQLAPRAGLAAAGRLGVGALRATPTALVARGGRALERTLGATLGGGVKARVAASIAAGAGETALYSGGMALSEAALENADLTAEQLLAHMGTGALLGGGAVGMFSLAGRGLGALARGVRKTRMPGKARAKTPLETRMEQRPRETSLELERDAVEAELLFEREPTKAIFEAVPEVEAPVKGWAGQVKQWGQDRKAYRDLQDVQGDVTSNITGRAKRLEEIADDALADLTIEKKLEEIGMAMKKDAPVSPMELKEFTQETMLKSKAELEAIIKNAAKDYSKVEVGAAKRLMPWFDEQIARLEKIAKMDDIVEAGTEFFGVLDQTKRMIGQARGAIPRKYSRGRVVPLLESEYYRMQEALVNADKWGRAAVDIQALDNLAWTKLLDVDRAYGRYFLEDAGGLRKAIRMKDGKRYGGFGNIRVPVLDRLKAAVMNANIPLHNKNDILRRRTIAMADLLEQLGTSHQATGKTAAAIKEARVVADDIIKQMDNASTTASEATAHMKRIQDAEDLGVPFLANGLKMVTKIAEGATKITSKQAGDRIKAVVAETGGEAGATMTTAERSSIIDHIRKMTENITKASGKAAKGFFKVAKEAERGIPIAVAKVHKESLQDRFEKKTKEHQQFIQNPSVLRTRIAGTLDVTGNVIPRTSLALSAASIRATRFLASKQPQPHIKPSDIYAHTDGRQRVSDSQMSEYLRYTEGVENPMQTLKDFGNGTVTREQAEALRVVYPQMFSELEQQVTTELVDRKEPLPYASSIRLSILLDKPLHPTLEPSFIRGVQQMYGEEKAKKEGPLAPSQRTVPDMAKAEASQSQRLEI